MQKKAIKIDFANGKDIEALVDKIDGLFKDALSTYDQELKSFKSKVNSKIKPMVESRSQLARDLSDFESSYQKLVGKAPSNDVPFVKKANDAIKRADTQIDDLTKKLGIMF